MGPPETCYIITTNQRGEECNIIVTFIK